MTRYASLRAWDVRTRSVVIKVYPPDSLDDGDRQRIRMLAMPDCNTTQIGDCFYCFRWAKGQTACRISLFPSLCLSLFSSLSKTAARIRCLVGRRAEDEASWPDVGGG